MPTVEQVLMAKGPDVIIAGPTTTVREAALLMAQADVGAIIIKEGADLVGIFTDRDAVRRILALGRNPGATVLRDVMSSPVRTCRLTDDIRTCAQVLARERIRHLAVVEGGALVGVISQRDVLGAGLQG